MRDPEDVLRRRSRRTAIAATTRRVDAAGQSEQHRCGSRSCARSRAAPGRAPGRSRPVVDPLGDHRRRRRGTRGTGSPPTIDVHDIHTPWVGDAGCGDAVSRRGRSRSMTSSVSLELRRPGDQLARRRPRRSSRRRRRARPGRRPCSRRPARSRPPRPGAAQSSQPHVVLVTLVRRAVDAPRADRRRRRGGRGRPPSCHRSSQIDSATSTPWTRIDR